MCRCPRSLPFAVTVALVIAPWLPAQRNTLAEPMVAIVADGEHGARLESLLRGDGMRTRRFATADCVPAALRLADVVVVAWPEAVEFDEVPPFGDLARWDRPTVFVGCGERFARAWALPTPAEIAERAAADRWPETWRFDRPDGAAAAVLRQGHLFHFQSGPEAVFASAAEPAWLALTVRHAARFVTDRPIVRHPAPNGAPWPAAEMARRQRIEAAAATLALDPTDLNVLLRLPDRLDGEHAELAATLLQDLVADAPDPDTTRRHWHNWLKPRLGAMVFDPLSWRWRLDPVAHWRGKATTALFGDGRADGGERHADAVALATQVVQRYGGRAFDDLSTFTCWQGELCLLWDRRGGWFRVENHGELPAGARATPWTVTVFDTAADTEVIWGGGPAPRPRVSGRGFFRDLVVRAFLPALLLDPGTSLHRDHAADSQGRQVLVVGLAVRGLDPRLRYRLTVDPATGTIERLEEERDGRVRTAWLPEATTPCGPMQLPTAWVTDHARRRTTFAIEAPTWNAVLPAGLESATELLTEPRER